MTTLTISKSGTAWIQDMKAQGKPAGAGWSSSPDAAYYASLDTDHPLAKPVHLPPTSFAELLKSHAVEPDDTPAAIIKHSSASQRPAKG